jgi:CheY-like chemotaxis protein
MPGYAHSALRVLVVDDNVDTAACLAMLLNSWGHETAEAHDGPEAIRIAQEQRPHAVVLDIGLPGMDGFEVARRLRRLPGFERVPMIIVTANGGLDVVHRALAAGAAAVVGKPLDVLDVLARFKAGDFHVT